MNAQDNNMQTQRFTAYRAMIPFHILYDLDLNANHLRLYGQIEQMENNPASVKANFSYSWLATQLGINRRNAIKTAKLLIEKGYIQHKKIGKGGYIWNTKKTKVVLRDEATSVAERHHTSVAERHHTSVAERHPKILKDKILKDNSKPPISPTGGLVCEQEKNCLNLEDLKNQNPHKISEELLREWFKARKKPITLRAWDAMNKAMTEIEAQGMKPVDAFNKMLDKQWQTLEARYFAADIAYKNPKTQIATKSKRYTMAEILGV